MTPEEALDYTAVQLFVENGRRAKLDFAIGDGNVAADLADLPSRQRSMQAVFDHAEKELTKYKSLNASHPKKTVGTWNNFVRYGRSQFIKLFHHHFHFVCQFK